MQKSCFWVSFVLLHLYDGIYNKRKFHIPLVYCWNLLMYLLQNYWAIQRRLGESQLPVPHTYSGLFSYVKLLIYLFQNYQAQQLVPKQSIAADDYTLQVFRVIFLYQKLLTYLFQKKQHRHHKLSQPLIYFPTILQGYSMQQHKSTTQRGEQQYIKQF